MMETHVGSVKLAAARMLGIFCAAALLTYFAVGSKALERTIEAVTQAIAFVGLSLVLFRLTMRDAMTLLGITVSAVVLLIVLALLIQWATVLG